MSQRVASIVADIGINSSSFDKGINGIIGKLGIVNKDFAKFGLAAGVAFGIVTTGIAALRKASDVTMTYADEVRKLSSVTMQSTEETSKMIQVLDDYKISSEQAGSAARFLAKEGLSLNIETLAKLSDEYKGLNSGQERAQFLMKNFGKAGQDFALVMDQGGTAIKAQGDKISKYLILSKKQVDAARAMEIAQDDLADAVQAYSVYVGSQVIPIQTTFLKGMVALATDTVKLSNALLTIDARPIDTATSGYILMAEAAEKAAIAAGIHSKEIEDARVDLKDFADLAKSISSGGSLQELAMGFLDVKLAAGEITFEQWERMGVALGQLTPTAAEIAGSIKYISDEAAKGYGDVEKFARMIAYLNGLSGSYSYNYTVTGQSGGYNPYTGTGDSNPYTGSGPGATPAVLQARAAAAAAAKKDKYGREAVGGPVGSGWTMVGEAGAELISPSGMVINAHNTRRMLGRGIVPGRRFATGGQSLYGPGGDAAYGGAPMPINYPSFSEVTDPTSKFNVLYGGADPKKKSSSSASSASSASAVINTAAAASQSASAAAKETSRAVDVTAQMSQQAAIASAAQAASLASIDRRLANMPNQIRDAFQQVIQQ